MYKYGCADSLPSLSNVLNWGSSSSPLHVIDDHHQRRVVLFRGSRRGHSVLPTTNNDSNNIFLVIFLQTTTTDFSMPIKDVLHSTWNATGSFISKPSPLKLIVIGCWDTIGYLFFLSSFFSLVLREKIGHRALHSHMDDFYGIIIFFFDWGGYRFQSVDIFYL